MSSSNKQIEEFFIKPLEGIFGVPDYQGRNVEELYLAMCDELKFYSVEALKGAVIKLRTHEGHNPLTNIGLCRRMCASASVEIVKNIEKTDYKAWDRKPDHRWSPEASLNYLKNSLMAHNAAYDGWIVALVEYVQEKHREPSGFEVDKIKQVSATCSAKINEILSGGGNLIKVAALAMQEKRERYKNTIMIKAI